MQNVHSFGGLCVLFSHAFPSSPVHVGNLHKFGVEAEQKDLIYASFWLESLDQKGVIERSQEGVAGRGRVLLAGFDCSVLFLQGS